MEAKVSFIIAAYNEESYIRECIESCLSQSYKNIEVCVTDDGSNDRTWDILKSLESERVIISRLNENQGKVPAFNLSYSKATGDYIALIGADDVNFRDRIESQINFLQSQKVDLTWGHFEHIDTNGDPLPDYHTEVASKVSKQMILEDNFIPGGTMLFTREVANKVFPIPEKLRFEDWWIAFHTVFHFKYSYQHKAAIKYRIHENSTVGDRRAEYHIIRRKNIRRHLLYHDLFERELVENDSFSKKNRMAKIYKEICLSDNFMERMKLFFSIIPNFQIKNTLFLFKILVVSLLGLPLLGRLFK